MVAALIAIAVSVLVLSPAFLVGFYIRHVRAKEDAKGRASMSIRMMRAPGHSLTKQIEQISEDTDGLLVGIMILPSIVCLIYLVGIHYYGLADTWLERVIGLLAIAGILIWQCALIARKAQERWKFMLGRDAEMAVGQELNMLMQSGAWVCHDFPGENFNIDHIVVTPHGVLAVETKSRRKPHRKGADAARVRFDGKALHFPDYVETAPIEQAIRQAEWLAKWLTSATGDKVTVLPVLALPGWYIERPAGRQYVQLTNGGEIPYLLKAFGHVAEMTKDQRQRIVHQLEQRCRDVEPFMYRKNAWKQPQAPAAQP